MLPSALRGRGDVCLGGFRGIEPGALHAEQGAVGSGDGGDERGHVADALSFAVAQCGVVAEGRKWAGSDASGLQIGLGRGVPQGLAVLPEPARGCDGVVCVVVRGGRARRGEREEAAGLVDGGVQ